MPEASVDKDGNLGTGEGNVDRASALTRHWKGDTISKAAREELMAKGKLGFRISSTCNAHTLGCLGR
jgi:hypothetical protein